MSLIIGDGQGTGNTVGVNSEHRLKVEAVTQTLEHHANVEGKSFNFHFQEGSIATDAYVAYIKSTNELDLIVEGIWLRSDVGAFMVDIYGDVDGTPLNTTNVTPANLNLGSGRTLSGTYVSGSDITSISSGYLVERLFVEPRDTSEYFNFEQDVIIPKNHNIAVYVSFVGGSGDSTQLTGSIVMHLDS